MARLLCHSRDGFLVAAVADRGRAGVTDAGYSSTSLCGSLLSIALRIEIFDDFVQRDLVQALNRFD